MMVIILFRQEEITEEEITLSETFLVARGLCSCLKLCCSSTLAILGTIQSFYWNAIANPFNCRSDGHKFSVSAFDQLVFFL